MGLRNPRISIPMSLYGSSRGGRKKELEVSKRGMEEVKKITRDNISPYLT